MLHKDIHKFQERGVLADDKYFVQTQDSLWIAMVEGMRENGYIPVFGLGPFWSTDFKDGKYHFLFTVYGIFVGKRKSWLLSGIDTNGTLYKPNTQKSK